MSAYFSGRAYQRGRSVVTISVPPSPAPGNTPAILPADFGKVLYDDIARIPFADLYETLRIAPSQLRIEWIREIEQMPESPRKTSALCGFFRALVQTDPRMAADLVIQLPRHRGPAMDAMISAAPPSAMSDLAEMLLKVPTVARDYQLTDHLAIVIDEWTQIDPEAVVRFFDAHKEIQILQYGDSFVKTWAGVDAAATWKWLESHSEEIQPFAVESWLTGWFSADPQAAVNFAFAHTDDDKFGEAIKSLAPELFQQNQTSAKEFVEKLPTTELREGALSQIAGFGSSPDYDYSPAIVAEFLVQFSPAEWPQEFSDVLSRWQMVGPSELLDWIAHLPPVIQTKVIDKFPAPHSNEAEKDLTPVLQLADSNLRMKLLRQLVRGMNSETQSAREAIEKLKLPPEQKAELAAFISDNPKR